MGRYFGIIIILVIVLGGGAFLMSKKGEETARQQIEEARVAAKRTFAELARAAANAESPAAYEKAIQAAIRSYEEELQKRVYAKKPEWRDVAAYEKEADVQFKEGKIKEAQHKSMTEGYKMVREAYDRLMAGKWRPVLTAKGSNSTRLDIYDLVRAKTEDGQPVLEGKFFFWGIEDSTHVSWGPLAMRFWKTEKKEVVEDGKKVEKDVDAVLGRAEGDSQPRTILQNPGKYVADFPSFVSIGTVWLPIAPPEAALVDIEYSYTAKIGGASSNSLLKWERHPLPAEWKLAAGEAWEADVVEATEDEIAGKDPNAPEEKAK